jgi:hypothetical protein
MADKAAADSRPEAGIARMPAALPGAGGDGGGDAKDGKDGPAVSGRRQRRQDQHRLLPRWIVVVGVVTSLVVCGLSSRPHVARAQDAASNNPDELKKSLADALNQLKAAQDRKNELATENEKLKQKIAEQEQQLTELHRDAAEHAARTWHLRSQAAAWEAFLQRYPNLLNRWKVFLATDPLNGVSAMPEFTDVTPAPTTTPSATISKSE